MNDNNSTTEQIDIEAQKSMSPLHEAIIDSMGKGTSETFELMCGIPASVLSPMPKHAGLSEQGVCGIIGLTGNVQGIYSLFFPESVALKITGSFIGEELTAVDENVVDAVKELANIIIGASKTHLESHGHSFTFSLPQIVVGQTYSTLVADVNSVLIPFSSDLGSFYSDVSLKIDD